MEESKLKKIMAAKLKVKAIKLFRSDKMKLCIDLEISPRTFERYTSGNEEEIRRLELANKILKKVERIIAEARSR